MACVDGSMKKCRREGSIRDLWMRLRDQSEVPDEPDDPEVPDDPDDPEVPDEPDEPEVPDEPEPEPEPEPDPEAAGAAGVSFVSPPFLAVSLPVPPVSLGPEVPFVSEDAPEDPAPE